MVHILLGKGNRLDSMISGGMCSVIGPSESNNTRLKLLQCVQLASIFAATDVKNDLGTMSGGIACQRSI